VCLIQKNILWGGMSRKRGKFFWICWKDVYKPKNERDLGEKDFKW
jgi:hypothetical protein